MTSCPSDARSRKWMDQAWERSKCVAEFSLKVLSPFAARDMTLSCRDYAAGPHGSLSPTSSKRRFMMKSVPFQKSSGAGESASANSALPVEEYGRIEFPWSAGSHRSRGASSRLKFGYIISRVLAAVAMVLMIQSAAHATDRALLLNAFGETSAAYANDAYLLLGTTADAFVADIIERKNALEIVTNVQNRVRIIRAKIKSVSAINMAALDKQFLELVDRVLACLDHQAWALTQYINEKNPDTAQKFVEQRKDCMDKIERIRQFYTELPPTGSSSGTPEHSLIADPHRETLSVEVLQ